MVDPVGLTSRELAHEAQTPAAEPEVVTGPFCEGCGRYHGSVNARLNCLRAHLRDARAIIASARLAMERM